MGIHGLEAENLGFSSTRSAPEHILLWAAKIKGLFLQRLGSARGL